MTEPDAWALELWNRAADAADGCATQSFGDDAKAAALTIQRAFEEQTQKLREALGWYADQMCEGICEGKDPKMCALIGADNCAGCPAVIALATRQDAPVTENSHDQ